jgi:signal transduction histidine kinase
MQGDTTRIRHAIDNLLDNALKYMPQGGSVRLSLTSDGDWAKVVVEDIGGGIPEEDKPHLFERFYRGRNTTGIQGSGLELALVKAIVEVHGGNIEEKSSEKGTTVQLSFANGDARDGYARYSQNTVVLTVQKSCYD